MRKKAVSTRLVKKYAREISALARIRESAIPVDVSAIWTRGQEQNELWQRFKDVIAPLQASNFGSAAIDEAVEQWWKFWRKSEIKSARTEIRIHNRLARLYQELQLGPEEEIEEFCRLQIRARLTSPIFRALAMHRDIGDSGEGD